MDTQEISVNIYPGGRMTADDAANYLGMSKKTLATKRCDGTGPKFIKIGRVFYFKDDLDSWLADQVRVTSTAEYESKKTKHGKK